MMDQDREHKMFIALLMALVMGFLCAAGAIALSAVLRVAAEVVR